MVGAWERACGTLDQYGMRHTRALANLCNAGLQPSQLGGAAAAACGDAPAARLARGGADSRLVAAA
jgi:legumain